jgi:DNA-binding response OmpR family regulator
VAGKTVLLVEDDEASIDIFTTILRHGGYEVLSAKSASAGVDMAVAHTPDVVVVDIGLPDAPGFDVLSELTEHPSTQQIPLIVCTVHVFEHDVVRAHHAGGDVFLRKPISPQDLLATVDRLLSPGAAPEAFFAEAEEMDMDSATLP